MGAPVRCYQTQVLENLGIDSCGVVPVLAVVALDQNAHEIGEYLHRVG